AREVEQAVLMSTSPSSMAGLIGFFGGFRYILDGPRSRRRRRVTGCIALSTVAIVARIGYRNLENLKQLRFFPVVGCLDDGVNWVFWQIPVNLCFSS
ncbi:MAG: hypothetical protein ACLQVD_20580, partial [Capsulimonadaceae bacterium]